MCFSVISWSDPKLPLSLGKHLAATATRSSVTAAFALEEPGCSGLCLILSNATAGCFSPPCQDYQAIVDAEWNILYDKLDKIHKSGAKVVLSKLPIGDVATQYFADRDMFCAGRVPEEDLKRTMMVSCLVPGIKTRNLA